MPASKIDLFVCEHGACAVASPRRSSTQRRHRVAGAIGGAGAQERASPALGQLLTGTTALDVLEREAPRRVDAGAERTIAIDCDVPADDKWVLDRQEAGAVMRDETHDLVAVLAAALRSVVTDRAAQ